MKIRYPKEAKKISFKEENLDKYGLQFMLEHDQAMGRTTRFLPEQNLNIVHVAMEELKSSPSIMPIM